VTFDAFLRNLGTEATARSNRPLETLDAVFDDQIWEILESYDLLKPLDAGQLRCHLTGVALSRGNLGGLIGTAAGPRLIADTSHIAVHAHR
jgi:hypothetical protein